MKIERLRKLNQPNLGKFLNKNTACLKVIQAFFIPVNSRYQLLSSGPNKNQRCCCHDDSLGTTFPGLIKQVDMISSSSRSSMRLKEVKNLFRSFLLRFPLSPHFLSITSRYIPCLEQSVTSSRIGGD